MKSVEAYDLAVKTSDRMLKEIAAGDLVTNQHVLLVISAVVATSIIMMDANKDDYHRILGKVMAEADDLLMAAMEVDA